MKKIKLALALSELVIYTKSRKFINFEDSRELQFFYENNSFGEAKARKLGKLLGNFLKFNMNKLILLVFSLA